MSRNIELVISIHQEIIETMDNIASFASFALYIFIFSYFHIGPAVLSSDMTSAYVLYFPATAAAAAAPPPIFPNHTNYQII